MTEVLIIRNHEGERGRLEVSMEDSLADVRDLIATEVEPEFIPPGGNFNFHYFDEEDDGLVQIFHNHEGRYKAVEFQKKKLTLLGAKRRKLGPALANRDAHKQVKVESDEETPRVVASSRPPTGATSPTSSNGSVHMKVENNQVMPASATSSRAPLIPTSPTSPTTSDVHAQVDADDERKPAAVTPSREHESLTKPTADDGEDSESVAERAETTEVEVKDEFEERKKQRKKFYSKYGDKLLLHRHDPIGIPRLGGGVQETYARPKKKHPNIFDAGGRLRSDYPVPKFLEVKGIDDWELVSAKESMLPFTYTCYNSLWQPNGPQYAGQPTAAVDDVPEYFKETGDPFPIFMKRSLTGRDAGSEGPILGWEYVGNYKVIKTLDAMEEDDSFWESASNFSKASKRVIAQKHYESPGYGRDRLVSWRSRLIDELEMDPSPAAPQYLIERRCPTAKEIKEKRPSLAARARALGFRPTMDNKDFSQLLVELDEFHGQTLLTFVEYDERIYEYCKGVKFYKRKNGRGKPLGAADEPAKAMDWYNFAETHGLITY